MKQIFVLILMFGISLTAFSQLKDPKNIEQQNPSASISPTEEGRNCGTTIYEEHLRSLDPDYDTKKDKAFREAQQIGANFRGAVVTIPVVVHVVYNTSAENISLTQIQSQIAVLNRDFRRTNTDANQTPSTFQGVAVDSEIEFCLASVDPNGNSTNGVTRTQTNITSFSAPYNSSSPEPLKFTNQGGKDAWDSDRYLNIWVADISGGVLGYATFPGTVSAAKDGVVLGYKYIGTSGTVVSPYNRGRTGTHEVGHYLGLRHIWGDGNCSFDDNISDTPTSSASYGGCPSHPQTSCGSTDMFMNYMDYVNDNCMNMFSQGQKNVMVGVLQSTGQGGRKNLISNAATACGVSPNPCNDLSGGPSSMGFEANENTGPWGIEDTNADGYTWRFADQLATNEFGPRTGTRYALYFYNDYNTTTPANDWFWSHCIGFKSGHQYEVSFWYAAGFDNTGTFPEKLEVVLSNTQNGNAVAGVIVPEFTISNPYPNYLQKTITFGINVGGDGYVGFHATSDADQYALQLDDILIKDITPVANEEVVENTLFQLYPNPASDLLHLELNSDNLIEDAEVRIYDMTGKSIINRQLNRIQKENITFDVSNVPNGIYIVNFIADGKISTEKVVISR